LASRLLDKTIPKNLAMTGEITLTGRVLPIGGLKEKLLAAKLRGIKKVLVPKKNEKDLKEISDEIKGGLNIVHVSHMNEVLKEVFGEIVNKEENIQK
jgi:ATP-dependent Lon protease